MDYQPPHTYEAHERPSITPLVLLCQRGAWGFQSKWASFRALVCASESYLACELPKAGLGTI